MYVPDHFSETRLEVLHQLVRDHPFAVLVTPSADGIDANHLPMEIDAQAGRYGTLLGHVARTNPMWRTARGEEALAIFAGPHGYVSPGWYPSKTDGGKVVPTWNYAVVHAYGSLRVIEETAWLRAFIERLTDRHESSRAAPWHVRDAPTTFVDAMVRGIVGIEVEITRLVGKWKLSQNRSPEDQLGVIAGLNARDDAASHGLAALMDRHRSTGSS